ncbi:MAG: NADH:ubiquinone reductase (Na(+)-transporting) subunit C [Bacteroidales bacterium]|nr:NADH:ubiquinone reductase (Na(+)-transporting) subunit C [Bacteroidales bacterium]
MKKFNNTYIFIYSTVLVVVVAAILATVAIVLKPFQQKNMESEQMQMILSAANIEVARTDAPQKYAQACKEAFLVNVDGQVVSSKDAEEAKKEAFNIDVKEQLQKYTDGNKEAKLPIFVCEKDNGEKVYVVPVRGVGLWGAIWGYVALKSDANTVESVVFDHEGETPGLGSNIKDDPNFRNKFVGKTIFEGNEFVSVAVEKRVGTDNPHKVDALTGATLTSNGVSDMLQNGLKFYVSYFNNLKK